MGSSGNAAADGPPNRFQGLRDRRSEAFLAIRHAGRFEPPHIHWKGALMPDDLKKKIQSLRDQLAKREVRRNELVDEMGAIADTAAAEKRSLSTDETRRFDEMRSEVEQIDTEARSFRERILELDDIQRRTDAAAGRPELRFTPRRGSGVDIPPGDALRMQPRDAVDHALRALDDRTNVGHLQDDQLERIDGLLRSTDVKNVAADYVARRLLITETAEYRAAWSRVMVDPHPVLTSDEATALRSLEELERAMSIGTPSAGGYGVPVFIDPTIVMTAQGSMNPFRRIGRVEQITTNVWKGVSSAGVTWSFDAEASAVSDDTPTLGQPTVTAFMARGFIPFSIELGMDYPNFAQEMARLLAEGYDELCAQKFAVGNGTTEPRGIITALDANTNVEVVVTTDGAFGAVDVNKAWEALPDRFKANANWVMSYNVGDQVAGFGNGNNLSFVTVDLTGVVQTLRQRPIAYSSYFPDFTGTTGAANLTVVGDFRNFLIAERAGMSVEPVQHLFDVTNNRPTGQRGWFAWARIGSDSIVDNAFRLLQNQ